MKAENCMEKAKAAPVAALQGAACVCRPPQAASGAAAAPQRWYLAQVGPACGPLLPARSPTVLLNGSPGSGVLLRLQGTVSAHVLISSLPHTAQVLDSVVIRWETQNGPIGTLCRTSMRAELVISKASGGFTGGQYLYSLLKDALHEDGQSSPGAGEDLFHDKGLLLDSSKQALVLLG